MAGSRLTKLVGSPMFLCYLSSGDENDPNAGAARGHYEKPKLINSDSAMRWKNLRVCSLNGRKIVAGAARGHGGLRAQRAASRRIAERLGCISRPSVSHGSTQFFHLFHL